MSYRSLPSGLKTSLENEEAYTYAHLIRFEKPRDVNSVGTVAGRARDYAYLTDGAFNIKWNDTDFKDAEGNANGEQTYVANRVLAVGTASETIEAKATSMSLKLSSNALNTNVTTTFTFTSSQITAGVDLLAEGFSEGDIIEFSASGEDNDGAYVRIDSFSNGNKTINYTYSSGTTITANATATSYTTTYASEEVTFLTESKDSLSYSSYLNREVSIFRVHLNPATGAMKGAPFLLFKGIITNGSINDNVTRSSAVTWTLTSHWGDFVQVNGRLTSDHAHRALDQNGNPDYEAAEAAGNIRYAEDLGFMHAENSVNVIATYQRPETRYKQKRRGGLAGVFGMKRLVEYEVMVEQDVDLRFNLQSKYLPVIYGVQKVAGFPIFAEADNTDPNRIFVAQAICEGPVQGLLDIHIDNNSLVCVDKADADSRGTGDDSVVACYGRADQGSVLNGSGYITNNTLDWLRNPETYAGYLPGSDLVFSSAPLNALDTTVSSATGGAGITHENRFGINDPLKTEATFHAGLSNQKANSLLVKKASDKEFKIQNDYYSDMPNTIYWGDKHQLLDTAYTVMDFTIAEGETTIPDYEFVVKGRSIDCFNYDYSYVGSGGDASNFALGEEVTIHKTEDDSFVTGTESTSTVQIIDKWDITRYTDIESYTDTRFRFSSNPQDGVTDHFYMKDSGGNKYYFATHDAKALDAAPTPVEIEDLSLQDTTILKSTTDTLSFTRTGNAANRVYKISGITSGTAEFDFTDNVAITFHKSDGSLVSGAITLPYSVMSVESFSNGTLTLTPSSVVNNAYLYSTYPIVSYFKIWAADLVKLHSNASSTDDTYNNQILKLKKFASGAPIETGYLIKDYEGTNRLAKLSTFIPEYSSDGYPDSGSEWSYTLEGDSDLALASTSTNAKDVRVSINPALQLLDYLTNKRYGKGLSLEKDIDLESFKAAARLCDTRSTITVQVRDADLTTDPTVGAVYKYPASGNIKFQGKIKSIKDVTVLNTDFKEIEFEEVIGKLGYKWTEGRSFDTDDVVWWNNICFSVGTAGTMTAATRNSRRTNNAFGDDSGDTRLNLTKVSGTGDATVPLSVEFRKTTDSEPDNHLGNPIVKKNSDNENEGFISSGYSLYDSDDCPYWVYLGWDEPEQREVTRHQTNLTVDTSQSVFANVNAMLDQFNGILRYAAGKYVLDVKQAAPADSHFDTDYPVKDIQEGDIIGDVKLQDSGSKQTFNTISASIVDPQNKFGARSITFVNSDYLKEDRGVKKTGNYNVPGVSNYFNARINVKQRLDESRYGLTATFTLDSKGYLLLAGDIIRITYSRFGWDNKYFRIDSLNFGANGLIQVVATEHNNDAYLINHMASSTSGQFIQGGSQGNIPLAVPGAPSAIVNSTTTDRAGYIELNWANGTNFNYQAHRTQVARSATDVVPNKKATNVDVIAEVQTNIYTDNTDRDVTNSNTTYYYYVRHIYNLEEGKPLSYSTDWASLGNGIALPIAQTEVESGIDISDGGITFEGSGDTGASIKSTGTSYNSGNDGFFLGWDNSNSIEAFKFFVGDVDGDKLTFDGNGNLTITGEITADSGDIGGWNIDSNAIYVGTKVTSDAFATNDGDITLFSDGTDARISSKEFRIDSDGSAHFKGEVSISAGTAPSITNTTVAGEGVLLKSDGDVFFGDATASNAVDHRYVFFDQTDGSLTIKGILAPSTLDLTNTSNTTLPTNIKASGYADASIGKDAFKQEVWDEINTRNGTVVGGFYGKSKGYYKGEAEKTFQTATLYHDTASVTLSLSINDSFGGTTAFTGTALDIGITFQYSTDGGSTWTDVEAEQTFSLVATTMTVATLYTADISYEKSVSTLAAKVNYDFRAKIVRKADPNAWKPSSLATNPGSNDDTGSFVLFEAREGGNGDIEVAERVSHKDDSDTYIKFLADEIQVYAGDEKFATFDESTADTITFHKDVTMEGNLTVSGTTTTLNTATLDVEDTNITVNYHATDDTSGTADGAGLTIQDAIDASTNATLTWDATDDAFVFSDPIKASARTSSNDYAAIFTGNLTYVPPNTSTHNQISNGVKIVAGGVAGGLTDYPLYIQSKNPGTELFSITGAGVVKIANAFSLPTSDGQANQVLQTNGSGSVTWADQSAGGAVSSVTNFADNRVVTASGAASLNGESSLTFSSSSLHVEGSGSGIDTYGSTIVIGKTNGPKISSTQENADSDVQGLAFFTKNSATFVNPAVERMRIDNAGNVGIGTSSPISPLQVTGNDFIIRATGTTDGGSAKISAFNEDDGSGNAGANVYLESSGWGEGFVYVGAHYISAQGGNFNVRASSTNDIVFGNGTTERMRLAADGRLKVGTTTGDPQKYLHVDYTSTSTALTGNGLPGGGLGAGVLIQNQATGSGTYANLDFRSGTADGRIAYMYAGQTNVGDFHFITDNSGSPESKMVIKNDGKIGIGTSAPATNLHILDDATSSAKSLLTLERDVGGDLNTQTSFIEFRFVDTNTNEVPQVKIGAQVGPNLDANSQQKEGEGAFVVYTNNATTDTETPTGLEERMRVDFQGNVGIGVANPSYNLHVKGTTGGIRIENSNANSFGSTLDFFKSSSTPADNDSLGFIQFRGYNDAASPTIHTFADIYALARDVTDGAENGAIVFRTANSGGTPLERVRIESDGSVGIGDSTPSYKLDVNGTGRFTGAVTLDSTLSFSFATATTALDLNNNNIIKVNSLTFADAGVNEGLSWTGGNTALFESPDDLSNAAGNLQVTYGGTRRLTVNNTGIDVNGTITGATNVSKRVANTVTGGTGAENGANTWSKLATYSVTGNYNDGTFIYAVVSEEQSYPTSGILNVKVRWQDLNGSTNPLVSVEWSSLSSGNLLSYDSFKLINDGVSEDVELWVQKKITYGNIQLWELGYHKENITVTYESNSAWQSTAPSGTAVNVTSGTLTFAGKEVLVGDDFNNTTNLRLSGKLNVLASVNTNDAAYIRNSGTGAAFAVNQQGTGDILRVDDNSATKFIVRDGGNVGIGTASPNSASPLTIKSSSVSSTTSGMILEANANTNKLIAFGERSNGKARLHMYSGTTEKIAFYTDGTANHISAGNLGIGTSSPDEKLHVSGGNVKISTTDVPAKLLFKDSRASASSEISQRSDGRLSLAAVAGSYGSTGIEILANGNVGIGEQTPQTNLHVLGGTGSGASTSVRIGAADNGDSNHISKLEFAETANASGVMTYGFSITGDGNSSNDLLIKNHNNSTAGTTAIAIERENGNVAINRGSATVELDVDGTGWFRQATADGTALQLGQLSDNASSPLYYVKCDDTDDDQIEIYTTRWGSKFSLSRSSQAGPNIGVMNVESTGGDTVLNLYHQANPSTSTTISTAVKLNTSGASYFNGGDLGVGTASPTARLHVVESGNATNGIVVHNGTSGTGARSNVRLTANAAQFDIYTTSSAYTGVSGWADAGVLSTGSTTSGGLILNTQVGGIKFQYNTVTGMMLDSSRRVGINKDSSITGQLHVVSGSPNRYAAEFHGVNPGNPATNVSNGVLIRAGGVAGGLTDYALLIQAFNGTELFSVRGSDQKVRIHDAFSLPTTDGAANQVLKTNGSGVVSWADDAFANQDIYRGATYPNNNFLDFDDDALPDSITNSVSLQSVGGMAFIIDNNNNGTTDKFFWLRDSTTASSATELMELNNDGDLSVTGSLSATTKSFDIKHPTKEGMRLHHGSLEGPEHGVYVRGRAIENIIELPEYWTGLVDEKSITVQLTANGRFQKLYVEKVENNKVYLRNASWFSNKIDCYYMINGTRKDITQFEVEYAN